jgi:hypothetical protein
MNAVVVVIDFERHRINERFDVTTPERYVRCRCRGIAKEVHLSTRRTFVGLGATRKWRVGSREVTRLTPRRAHAHIGEVEVTIRAPSTTSIDRGNEGRVERCVHREHEAVPLAAAATPDIALRGPFTAGNAVQRGYMFDRRRTVFREGGACKARREREKHGARRGCEP